MTRVGGGSACETRLRTETGWRRVDPYRAPPRPTAGRVTGDDVTGAITRPVVVPGDDAPRRTGARLYAALRAFLSESALT